MSHVSLMNESCLTYEWVMSHVWMSHVTHEWVTSHMNESRHTYEWVMSHIWKSHVTHMNESRHTCECVMSHIWMSHVTHVNESCHTYDRVSTLFVCEFAWCDIPHSDMCVCIQLCVGVYRCVYVYAGIAVWVRATLAHMSLLLRIHVFSTRIDIYHDSVCSNICVWKMCVCVHKCRYEYTGTSFSQVSLRVHRHIIFEAHSYFSECAWGGGALTYICGL